MLLAIRPIYFRIIICAFILVLASVTKTQANECTPADGMVQTNETLQDWFDEHVQDPDPEPEVMEAVIPELRTMGTDGENLSEYLEFLLGTIGGDYGDSATTPEYTNFSITVELVRLALDREIKIDKNFIDRFNAVEKINNKFCFFSQSNILYMLAKYKNMSIYADNNKYSYSEILRISGDILGIVYSKNLHSNYMFSLNFAGLNVVKREARRWGVNTGRICPTEFSRLRCVEKIYVASKNKSGDVKKFNKMMEIICVPVFWSQGRFVSFKVCDSDVVDEEAIYE